MTPYDAKAWIQVQEWKQRQLTAKARRLVPGVVRKQAAVAGAAVHRGALKVPGAQSFEDSFSQALEAVIRHGLDISAASVRTNAVLAAYRKAGFEVAEISDIRSLTLEVIDKVMPRLGLAYTSAALFEGIGTGLAVTGGELTTPLGGPALVVGALATDIATMLLGSLRMVAHIAVYYGFDAPGDPEELLKATAVLGVGAAVGSARSGMAAYEELSRVTQQLAQDGKMARFFDRNFGVGRKIPDSPVSDLIVKILARLGIPLTATNVEKLLPLVGVAFGAGKNTAFFRRVATSADRLYRERWLMERYGLTMHADSAPSAGSAIGISTLIDEFEAGLE